MQINIPSIRVIFDRKRLATKKRTGLVQLEITFNKRRKFISTGVKVFIDQWSDRSHVIGRSDMIALNKQIDRVRSKIDDYIAGLMERDILFDFDAFDRWLASEQEKEVPFIEWVAGFIEQRKDIEESTRKTHRKIVGALTDFGKIVNFSELTLPNITKFDAWLRDKGIRQTTIWSYHKQMKTYINEAIRRGLLNRSPYDNFKVERGKSEWGRFLTPQEVERLELAQMPTESIARVRDLFLMQCYTGLAYSDLMAANFRDTVELDGVRILTAARRKTDVTFTTVVTDKAAAILERYNYELPKISNEQYNMRLKIAAQAAGIDKPIASHYGRRTCGMLLLNDGFPIEIVAKVLGHTSIKTTQEAYARIIDKTVAREFAKHK